MYIIYKNTSRYESIAPEMPDRIICDGTKEQAIALAERLTNYEAGCDYAFFVAGIDDGDEMDETIQFGRRA